MANAFRDILPAMAITPTAEEFVTLMDTMIARNGLERAALDVLNAVFNWPAILLSEYLSLTGFYFMPGYLACHSWQGMPSPEAHLLIAARSGRPAP